MGSAVHGLDLGREPYPVLGRARRRTRKDAAGRKGEPMKHERCFEILPGSRVDGTSATVDAERALRRTAVAALVIK